MHYSGALRPLLSKKGLNEHKHCGKPTVLLITGVATKRDAHCALDESHTQMDTLCRGGSRFMWDRGGQCEVSLLSFALFLELNINISGPQLTLAN